MGRMKATRAIYDDDGSAVLLPLRSSLRSKRRQLMCLEPAAGKVWRLLEAGASLDDAVAHIAGEYRIPGGRLRDDLQPVFDALRAQGIWEGSS